MPKLVLWFFLCSASSGECESFRHREPFDTIDACHAAARSAVLDFLMLAEAMPGTTVRFRCLAVNDGVDL